MDVATSLGHARLHLTGPAAGPVLALGHGAGGGVEASDLQAVALAAARAGWRVVLVEQPWRVAGRRVAAPPAHLDRGWQEALAVLPAPVVVAGGRSAGARVACRTADALGVHGLLLLAFPLHPPGRPERSRADELSGLSVPALAVQGERDPFGTPAEVAQACPSAQVVPVVDADHALRVPKRSASAGLPGALDDVMAFLGAIPGGATRGNA